MDRICQVCRMSPATTVINSLALCQQCSLPKFVINPSLPTLSNVPIEGEARECRQCHFQLSKTTAKCNTCGYVELGIVADNSEEEEEKVPLPQSTKPVVNSVCWTCPRCSYEYNQKHTVCQKCQQPYKAPAVTLPSKSKSVTAFQHQLSDHRILPLAGDPEDANVGEMSPGSQSAPLTSLAKWRCQCGFANPVFSEICYSCKRSFPQCATTPWKCIHCAQNTNTDPCAECRQKQGWSQYVKKKSVTLNAEKWMWQCKSCKLWTRIDISTCYFGHTNEQLKTALEGTASQSSGGVFGTLKGLFS